ncbi:protein kinase domain-containing protein [Nocardioides sp. Root151]|uniref:protein kinase domain-containing protein n=1 Tax=Nocardioides sp. Root151 TaxID=1736475 RepID=UPI0007024DA4|nr:protein kinase [Nocardioides sp. Root151]KQZ68572.1 hypothetical protein ASD66_14840 [Nocardioides sp. Root151]
MFGRFEVGRRLGAGGMGAVYVATDTRFDRLVALKVMSEDLAGGIEFRKRFRREADVLARLDSPHVTAIYEHGEDDGTLWIATQLVRGGELGNLLRLRGPLPPRKAVRVCGQVAEALRASHSAGVLHRDVKPSNVLLRDPDAANLHAYLCDFGIADTGNDRLTAAGGLAGTWQYLAPERGGGAPATPATDIYAVGCLLWACLTGHPPYSGSGVEILVGHLEGDIRQLPGDGPEQAGLNEVLRRAMAKDPADRYSSAADLRDALARLEAELPASMPPLRPSAPSEPTARPRRRGRMIGAAVLALLLVGGGIGAAWALRDDDGDRSDGSASPSASGSPSASPSDGGTSPSAEPSPSASAKPAPPVRDPSTKQAVTFDLNGDGRGDLAFHDAFDATPAVMMANGGGFFAAPAQVLRKGLTMVVRGDLDGDGAEEIVGVEKGSEYSADGTKGNTTMTVTVGSASGTPQVLKARSAMGVQSDWSGGAMLADLDGDGRDDLVLATANAEYAESFDVWAAISTGDGFERLKRLYSGPEVVSHVEPADVDGDGDDDLVLADESEGSLAVLESGGGTFTPTDFEQTLTTVDEFMIGDFNGDGADDVLTLDGVDSKAVVLQRKRGAWDAQVWLTDKSGAFGVGWSQPGAAISDVNGDGKDDLVQFAGTTDPQSRTIRVFVASRKKFAPPVDWGTYTCGCEDYTAPIAPRENM